MLFRVERNLVRHQSYQSKLIRWKTLQKLQSSMKNGIKNKDLHEKVLLFAPLLQKVFSPSHTRKKKLQSTQDGLTRFDPAPHQIRRLNVSQLGFSAYCIRWIFS